MATIDIDILECFKAAKYLANYKDEYIYGGGHPYSGYALGMKSNIKGFDCDGWVSDILRHGNILECDVARVINDNKNEPQIEDWGLSGEGQYMTLWYHNGPELKHCFLEFKIPGEEQYRFSMAAHTGTICGWYKGMSTKGYTPRRRK
jgi:hypothetical protein